MKTFICFISVFNRSAPTDRHHQRLQHRSRQPPHHPEHQPRPVFGRFIPEEICASTGEMIVNFILLIVLSLELV